MRADGACGSGRDEGGRDGGEGAPEEGLCDPIASLEVRGVVPVPRHVHAVHLPYVRAHWLRREHSFAGARHLDRGAAAIVHGHGDSVAVQQEHRQRAKGARGRRQLAAHGPSGDAHGKTPTLPPTCLIGPSRLVSPQCGSTFIMGESKLLRVGFWYEGGQTKKQTGFEVRLRAMHPVRRLSPSSDRCPGQVQAPLQQAEAGVATGPYPQAQRPAAAPWPRPRLYTPSACYPIYPMLARVSAPPTVRGQTIVKAEPDCRTVPAPTRLHHEGARA